jgi:hypothetical protein
MFSLLQFMTDTIVSKHCSSVLILLFPFDPRAICKAHTYIVYHYVVLGVQCIEKSNEYSVLLKPNQSVIS